MKPWPDPQYRHRFPAEIISHAVWLYHVFSLSLRDVELILAERGVDISYETIRRWCKKFGANFADCLRRRRPRPGDKWHLDEVFIRIQGVQHYLWRAVDQNGVVLDILVQPRRNANAAKRFFKRLLKSLQYVPRVIVTDKLWSYGVAQRRLLPGIEHRQSRYLTDIFDKHFFASHFAFLFGLATALFCPDLSVAVAPRAALVKDGRRQPRERHVLDGREHGATLRQVG